MPPDAGDEWVSLREGIADQIQQLFEIAKIACGEEEARRMYQAVLARPRGRPKGSKRAPEKDEYLLRLYYMFLSAILLPLEASAQPRPRPHQVSRTIAQLPRFIGTYLDRESAGEYGNSIKAIETQLRRLLERRKVPRPGLINSAAAAINPPGPRDGG